MQYEICYGTIPVRKINKKWQVFLLLHKKGLFWGFSKGHSDKKEDSFMAAKRELKEETSLEINRQRPFFFMEQYQIEREGKKIQKKIVYFLVEVKGEISLQKEEILDGKWIDVDQSYSLITFPESKKIMSEVEKILEKE